ncbi:hypothetical protein LTR56_012380 [Elasticomyces elasticus]|nr:hypothetical protein LTR56_012380 [Elasticomyces elasticus]KAK3652340.1 hypothetical protein LTR22_011694 [Elasticomyces elasticus]KAK4918998.1 hypothetical protein LTR49_013315 [Elasticomyces elasticus]KAK5756651.1 hypothetical protein LTS12_013241 [Elasticomyces elasticus]
MAQEAGHDRLRELIWYNDRYIQTPVDSRSSFDPFDSLAVSLGPTNERLLRHYVDAGESLFHDRHPHTVLLRENGSDKACVHGMQAYAAYDLARKHQCTAAYALSKRITSINSINQSLRDPNRRYSDSTVGAILGAIAIDVQPASSAIRAQHRLEAGVHIDGVVQLLSQRGGPTALPDWLQVFYYWMDIQTAGMLSASQYRITQRSAAPLQTTNGHRWSFHTACLTDLADFYTEAYTAAKRRVETGYKMSASLTVDASLGQVLAADVHSRPSARTATLLYLVALIMQCDLDMEIIAQRLSRSRVLKSERNSAEAMCFALITRDREDGSHAIADQAQASRLARHMFAYARVARHLQQRFETSLYNILFSADLERDMVWTPTQLKALLIPEDNSLVTCTD